MFEYRFRSCRSLSSRWRRSPCWPPPPPHGQLLGPQKVVVTNTASNPVPTVAQGTTTVAGTVQAQQAGARARPQPVAEYRPGRYMQADPVPVAQRSDDVRAALPALLQPTATDFPNALSSIPGAEREAPGHRVRLLQGREAAGPDLGVGHPDHGQCRPRAALPDAVPRRRTARASSSRRASRCACTPTPGRLSASSSSASPGRSPGPSAPGRPSPATSWTRRRRVNSRSD